MRQAVTILLLAVLLSAPALATEPVTESRVILAQAQGATDPAAKPAAPSTTPSTAPSASPSMFEGYMAGRQAAEELRTGKTPIKRGQPVQSPHRIKPPGFFMTVLPK